MEINGLPLHALANHAAVVLGPLAALAGLLYAVVPRFRDWLRWPVAAAAVVGFVAIWVTYLSGQRLQEANPTFYTDAARAAMLETHASRADVLRWAVTAFTVAAGAAAWFHRREGATRLALMVAVGVTGALTLVYTVLTGDAGAQLKWAGYEG